MSIIVSHSPLNISEIGLVPKDDQLEINGIMGYQMVT